MNCGFVIKMCILSFISYTLTGDNGYGAKGLTVDFLYSKQCSKCFTSVTLSNPHKNSATLESQR